MSKILLLSGLALAVSVLISVQSASAQSIQYQGHVQGKNWMSVVADGNVAGTTGQDRRLEAVRIFNPSVGGQVCYQAYVQDHACLPIQCNGGVAGTTGQGKRMQALTIWYNNPPFGKSLQFRGHLADFGWESIKSSGSTIGTANGNPVRIEGVELNIFQGSSLYWQ